jgi:surfeit locus 1 family protein
MMAMRRSFLVLTVLALAGLAVLIGLGLWQLQRRAEKETFLSAIQRAATRAPKPVWADAGAFERVQLSGSFDAERTVFVRVTTGQGLGVYVMTPLLLRGPARLIYVNRGVVPASLDGRPAAFETPTGPVTIIGYRRTPEARGTFAPADEPQRRLFAVRDTALFADVLGLPVVSGRDEELTQLAIERDYVEMERIAGPAPNGVAVAELVERIPNNHLHYALTWFGLAATLLGVWAALAFRLRRG